MIGKHFVRVRDLLFLDAFVILIKVVDDVLKLILRFEERVVGEFDVEDIGSGFGFLDKFFEVESVLLDPLFVSKRAVH